LLGGTACGDDDGGGSHYCCTLQTLCRDCSCDASERTIADSNDESACQQLLDSGSLGCSRADEVTALAACVGGDDGDADREPFTLPGSDGFGSAPFPGTDFAGQAPGTMSEPSGTAGASGTGSGLPAPGTSTPGVMPPPGEGDSSSPSPAPTPAPGDSSSCGDGVRSGDEDCDGDDFGGLTCALIPGTAGPAGALSCTATCEIDISTCMAAPPPPAAAGEPCEAADQCESGQCCDGPAGGQRVCGSEQGCPLWTGEPCDPQAEVDLCLEGFCEPGLVLEGSSGFCSKDCYADEDCGMHSGGGANLCLKLGPESSRGSCSPDCTGDCAHLGGDFACVPLGNLELCLDGGQER
jgi:hypothetical protein